MEKMAINPPTLARPSGYSHGMVTNGGRMLFLAGQPALDNSGNLVSQGDIVGQFNQAFRNIHAVLVAAGAQPTDLVKLTIYVTDKHAYIANRKRIGEAYRSFFGHYYPAITLVEVKDLFDDGAMVEIDGIAVVPESGV